MADEATTARREVSTVGYGDHAHAQMVRRRAEEAAGFFLPHLRPGGMPARGPIRRQPARPSV
jgi:hypothetical protein